jgi:ABC-type lipoprotein release transport system permease subunit
LLPILTSLDSTADMETAWHILLDHEAMANADLSTLQSDLDGLTRDLGGLETHTVLYTGLDKILQRFGDQSSAVRAPLYVLTAEIVLLALYYVTMVAALSMGSAEREFAVLRSRGASGWQITRIQLTEAGLIAGVALLSGPLLGSVLVRFLSWAGPLADVGTSTFGLSPTQSAWLAAGAGAVACLAGLLLPLGPALRRSIVTHQQHVTRAARPPWWQRIYLDVFLLSGGLILLWRLHLYGEIVIGGASGPRVDWLLLLSPLALLLGTAAILLRVFPLVLRGLAAMAARARGLSGALALWQAARNPTHVARLVLLLTLAIALGILSTGLNATLDQSETERANYIAGNDMRLASDRAIPLLAIQSTPGVDQLAGAWRGEGTVRLQSARGYPHFDALAIEPYAFAEVTQYRDDFSSQYMGQLLGYLVAERDEMPPTLALPGVPSRLGLWLRTRVTDEEYGVARQYLDKGSDLDRFGLTAKLQTAQGELFTVELEPSQAYQPPDLSIDQFELRATLGDQALELHFDLQPVDDGWRYFDAPMPMLPASSYPLRLHALWFRNQARSFGRTARNIAMQLSIDDLSVLDGETEELLPVETFEDPLRIWSVNSVVSNCRFTKEAPHTGEADLNLDLRFSDQEKMVSLQLTKGLPDDILPALVSPAFLQATELEVGDLVLGWIESIEVKFKIVGMVRYFPTLYEEQEAGFLVTSLDRLLPLLNATSRGVFNINQVFLESDGSVSVDRLSESVPQISQSWQAEAVRKTFKANPLGLGLRSVTFFGYTLTTLLSLVGFATHFYMSARQRETFYGVMRAMGLSPRQLYGSMILEQAVLILTGLALGTVLGVALNQVTLPRLPIALGAGPPVPPFRPQADWIAVGRIYVVLAIAFLLALGLATGLLWRARVHRALRIGQE